MKFLESIKEIWKANKWGYLNAIIVGSFGCLFLFVKNKSPLEYTLPFMFIGTFVLMYAFAFAMGGKD